jgi:hypothetical protein
MATPDYPSTLPAPEYGSYAGVMDAGLVRTQAGGAEPYQDATFNSEVVTLNLSFSMDDADFDAWFAWVDDNGYDWFYMDLVTPLVPVDILSRHKVRFVADYLVNQRGDNWQRITVGAEMIPNEAEDPLAPVPQYNDFIVAGTPASPSPDDIQAGTPASPSTGGLISAELYYY